MRRLELPEKEPSGSAFIVVLTVLVFGLALAALFIH